METKKNNKFLTLFKEKSDMNQYWYSKPTIEYLVSHIMKESKKAVFISTPSIYISLPKSELKSNSFLFEYDKNFEKFGNFQFYDFNEPLSFDEKHIGQYDFVLIDPPFITADVWKKYAETALKLIQRNEDNTIKGKFLVSSIAENSEMLKKLLNVEPCKYQPSIPNLVYQYNFYSNYQSDDLEKGNEEISN